MPWSGVGVGLGDKAESLGTRWRCKHVRDRPSPYLPSCHNGCRKQHQGHNPEGDLVKRDQNQTDPEWSQWLFIKVLPIVSHKRSLQSSTLIKRWVVQYWFASKLKSSIFKETSTQTQFMGDNEIQATLRTKTCLDLLVCGIFCFVCFCFVWFTS